MSDDLDECEWVNAPSGTSLLGYSRTKVVCVHVVSLVKRSLCDVMYSYEKRLF